MLPQIKQIQRFELLAEEAEPGVGGGQAEQYEVEAVDVNGMGTLERDVFAEVGWEDISVCEYRHTGHLQQLRR